MLDHLSRWNKAARTPLEPPIEPSAAGWDVAEASRLEAELAELMAHRTKPPSLSLFLETHPDIAAEHVSTIGVDGDDDGATDPDDIEPPHVASSDRWLKTAKRERALRLAGRVLFLTVVLAAVVTGLLYPAR